MQQQQQQQPSGINPFDNPGAFDADGRFDQRLYEQEQEQIRAKRSSKEVLQDTVRVAQEARDVGADTMVKLDEQKRQVQRIQENVDDINDTLSKSEYFIRSIKSWGGMLRNAFSKPPKADATNKRLAREQSKDQEIEEQRRRRQQQQQQQEQQEKERRARDALLDGQGGAQQQQQQQQKGQVPMDPEMDQQLDTLSHLMKDLKGMAEDMGTAIDESSVALDKVNDDMDRTNVRVAHNNKQLRRILKE